MKIKHLKVSGKTASDTHLWRNVLILTTADDLKMLFNLSATLIIQLVAPYF